MFLKNDRDGHRYCVRPEAPRFEPISVEKGLSSLCSNVRSWAPTEIGLHYPILTVPEF